MPIGLGKSIQAIKPKPAATKATVVTNKPTSYAGNVTSVRKGDYIYKYRDGVLISTTYSPTGRQGSPSAANPVQAKANDRGAELRTTIAMNNAKKTEAEKLINRYQGGTMANQNSPVYGTSASGSYYGQDNSAAGPVGAASGDPYLAAAANGSVTNNDNNVVGEPGYGWTKSMEPMNVKAAVEEYPMRILQQVMGQDLSKFPSFQNFMADVVAQANNPFVQLLMNPGIGGKGHESTVQDAYNFQANLMKNMVTPGGVVPDIGTAIANIAAGLKDSGSGVYKALMGAGGTGMDAYGSQMDALNSMLAPVLGLGASPLQQMITSGALSNAQNNFLLNANFAKPQDPLAYVLKYLGYPTQTAAMPTT